MAEEERTAKGDSNKDEDILAEALEQFAESQEASSHNREAYEDDVKFGRLGEQWPDEIKRQRRDESRPCLTINKIPTSVRSVLNDARQNKPGIIVHPVDNGADKETAEVINGLIRSIERNSQADTAYITALDNAVSGGFGFFRIGIDFADNDTFDMECKIERVANSLSVHWDVNTARFDAADWNYAFVSDVLSKDEFESSHPGAKPVSFESDSRSGFHDGLDNDEIRVAEYWQREMVTRKLLLLSDGRSIREEQLTDEGKALLDITGVRVIKEREVQGHKIIRRIISGAEILESDPWPGELIPICPIWGEEIVIGGKRYLRSMFADSRDSQVIYNYMRSASTEIVGNNPRTPWIGPTGFIPEDQRGKWETSNSRSWAFMEFDGPERPFRPDPPGVPTGILQEALNASDDMKATMGIFDASLGAQGNETSGRAILARQRQGDVSQFHFIDNLSRAMNYAGRVMVEVIPYVYTPRSAIRIIGEDEKEEVVRLASGELQPDKESGNEKLYDLNVGKYDVSVRTGPSYASQREETREVLLEIVKSMPEAAALMGDKVLEYMDFQGADVIAERLKSLLPPAIQKAEADKESSSLPPEAQQAVGQAQAEVAQLKQQLQQGSQVLQEGQKKMQALENNAALEGKRLEVEENKAQRSAEIDAMKLENERIKLERERGQLVDETEGRDRLAAVEQSVNAIAAAVSQSGEREAQASLALAEALNNPKRIVRDEEGKIVGIETEQPEFEFNGNGETV